MSRNILEQGFGRNQFGDLKKESPNKADEFVRFVHMIKQELGLPYATPSVELSTALDPSSDSIEHMLHQVWNEKAADWLAVESESAYYGTMSTLLTSMELQPKETEHILSLGSGPGLYETYLSVLFEQQQRKNVPFIHTTDFSEEMVKMQQHIVQLARRKTGCTVAGLTPELQNMAKLRTKTKSIDQIICNNSLQWVPNWKNAIKEMARVITPEKSGYLYLFLNENPLTALRTMEGDEIVQLPQPRIDEIIETFEHYKFQIIASRHLVSPQGQIGSMQRRFFHAQYRPLAKILPWKHIENSGAEATIQHERKFIGD